MNYSRRERIRQLLEKNGFVSIKQLMEEFPGYSTMTIRRDLDFLESIGEAIRVRGGARLIRNTDGKQEASYSKRAAANVEAKEKIAKNAVCFIETGRSVFLDSGSTSMELAKLAPDQNFSIVTTDPKIALEMVTRFNPTVNLVGGVLSHNNRSVSGMLAAQYIKGCNIDIAFIVPSAFSCEEGFSCGNNNEADIKRTIVLKSKHIIVLLDSSKFDKNMPFTFASLDEVDLIVTDKKPADKILEVLQQKNIKIIY